MEVEKLKDLGRALLNVATRDLVKNKGNSPRPVYLICDKQGQVHVARVPGFLMNSGAAKAALGEMIRDFVAKLDAQAVLLMIDVYQADVRPAEGASPEELRRVQEQIDELGVVEAAKRGLCKKREAIMVCIESPIYTGMMRQFYSRIEEGENTLDVVLEESDEPQMDGVAGRLMGFFNPTNTTIEDLFKTPKEPKVN